MDVIQPDPARPPAVGQPTIITATHSHQRKWEADHAAVRKPAQAHLHPRPGLVALTEGDGPENCYAVGAFLIYSSRRYGVEFCDVFTRRARPAAVRASRAIQVAC